MKKYSKKQAKIYPEKNLIKISFYCSESSEFSKTLEQIKGLSKRRYNSPWPKAWSCANTEKNIKDLESFGFAIERPEPEYTAKPELTAHKSIKLPEKEIEGLYDYQIEALQFLTFLEGKGLIGLPPGAGKTFVGLYYLKINPSKRPALVVCPAPIKLQWGRETNKVLNNCGVYIISGETPYELPEYPIYIINWDILKDWEPVLLRMNIPVIIGDEVQAIGNESKRTDSYVNLVKKQGGDHIALSGTPFYSKIRQFFNILNLLCAKRFATKYAMLCSVRKRKRYLRVL
jgi:superfamily II DNA or RNA helicase